MHSEFPTQPSYRDQRQQFIAAATAAGATLCAYVHPLAGPFGESLSTDVAVVGDPRAKRRLVALTGTHGVEVYYGFECQIKWLKQFTPGSLPEDVAVVMILGGNVFAGQAIYLTVGVLGNRVYEDRVQLAVVGVDQRRH